MQIRFAEQKKIANLGASNTREDCCDETATTTFADEGIVVERKFTKTPTGDATKAEMYTICDFLAKPVCLSITTWDTSQAANAVLFSAEPGSYIQTGGAVQPWIDKVKGFRLARGTFVLRVTMNAMPFHAGALLIHYLPNRSAVEQAGYTSFTIMHNVDLTTKTQQPSMELMAGESSAVFEIPYIAPTNWFPISNAGNYSVGWGTVYISVLSPLATGALQDGGVDVGIYGYWKDFELCGPIVPQSSTAPRKPKTTPKRLPRKSVVSDEEERTTGAVSNALSSVSVAAGALSNIPSLTPLMGPLAWATQILSGTASAFGYSKPLSSAAPGLMALQSQRYHAVSDGVDVSVPLGLIHNNSTMISDNHTVYEGDEMSFAFLKRIPALTHSTTWAKLALPGQELLRLDIAPSLLCRQGSLTVGTRTMTYKTGPPIHYLHRMFSLWRGSIKVRMKIVKTQYHTGRLQIAFVPSPAYVGVPGIYTNAMYTMREIVDIRATDEIEFTLPYINEYEYLSTGRSTTGAADEMYSAGTFIVTILNDLKAPDTVASTVDLLFYFSGGDDFQFGAPVFDSDLNYRMNNFAPHMDDTAFEGTHKTVDVIGSNIPTPEFSHSSHLCLGEEFTSVKQLINRMTPMNQASLNVAYGIVDPWFVDVTKLEPVTGNLQRPSYGGDAYSYVSKMFMYFKGSSRLHFFQNGSQSGGSVNQGALYATLRHFAPTNFITSPARYITSYEVTTPLSTSTSRSTSSGMAVVDYNGSCVTLSVPYHARTPVSFVIAKNNAITETDFVTQPFAYPEFTSYASGSALRTSIHRSMKDDFQLSFFIGCPPVVDNYT